MTAPFLSVVLPAYNEEANLNTGVLSGLVGYLKSQKYTWEIILVNDGSSDGTQKLLSVFSQKTRELNSLTTLIWVRPPRLLPAPNIPQAK